MASTPPVDPINTWQGKLSNRPLLTIAYGSIILLHLLLPLRHHYFDGPVVWTEEGHRYAWRMMLRIKQGSGHFKVVLPDEDETIKVRPENYMDRRQSWKMYSHPDMILQFAHFLRDEYIAKGHENVEVYAQIKVGLNYRKKQTFIDPEVDLAQEKWSFLQSSPWIVPLKEPIE